MSGTTWRKREVQILQEMGDAPMAQVVAALRAAGYERSEQGVRLKCNRLWPERGFIWPRAQVDYLCAHWRDGDLAVSIAVSKIGPLRTVEAVKAKRHKAGLFLADSPVERREKLNWPVVASDPREQDRNYIRALLADLRRKPSTDSSPAHFAPHHPTRLTPVEAAYSVPEKRSACG